MVDGPNVNKEIIIMIQSGFDVVSLEKFAKGQLKQQSISAKETVSSGDRTKFIFMTIVGIVLENYEDNFNKGEH